MKVLHIDSSMRGHASISRIVSARIVRALVESGDDVRVAYRDLAGESLAILEAEATAGQVFVEEFLAADTIVIGAPMYNLGVPWRLKAWVDAICVAKKTFEYTATGPRGLAGGRKVIVAYACGGFHRGPTEDFVEPYLRAVFGLLGIADVGCIRAEGVNISEELKSKALGEADEKIATLIA